VIAPALEFLVALIFKIMINFLLHYGTETVQVTLSRRTLASSP